MTDPKAYRDHYRAEFARLTTEHPGPRPGWLDRRREEALERFAALGFPTPAHEEWKYTNVAPVAATPFRFDGAFRPEGLSLDHLRKITFGEMDCTHLVFVNGRLVPELSHLRKLPAGVIIDSLAARLREEPDHLEPHLGRHAVETDQAFTALNTAFLQDGAYIYLPRGVVLPDPVHLIFVSAPNGDPGVSHPRNLVVAESGSQAAVVESYVAFGTGAYFTNAVTEVVAGENAVIDHCKLQREGEGAFHVSTLQARLSRNTRFASHAVTLGGVLTRNDINAVLDDEGAECVLNGLYLATGGQHIDNHTFIDHAKPRCASREFYKGVLAGRSHGVFNGKIRVAPDAQKTDAKQTNKNLLLSEEALVDTKPQLEIYADDVKCTHGATVGQLDDEALFYLRSRGISADIARSLLVHAFASDVLGRIPVKPIRTGLECILMTHLPVGIERREPA